MVVCAASFLLLRFKERTDKVHPVEQPYFPINSQKKRPLTRHHAHAALGAVALGDRMGLLADARDDRPSHIDDFSDAIHGIFKQTCAMGVFPPTLARRLRLPVWARLADCLDRALAHGAYNVARELWPSAVYGLCVAESW